MRQNPKRNFTRVNLTRKSRGLERRKSYAKDILENAPIFPRPLEYEDIDKEMFSFFDKNVELNMDGQRIPMFTLYSTQRFSEYTQTWSHTDNEGNLLMNFKTISRENNPSAGQNQGGHFNIPGDRRYTLLLRSVLDDNGTESYEVYSMSQPMAVDLVYKVSFVTSTYEMLNEFNMSINSLFKAKQCYIRPNDHYMPLVLDGISDDSQYSLNERKFFVQTVTIKCLAYIIRPEDFKVEKFPRRHMLLFEGENNRFKKPQVDIEEYYDGKNNLENKNIDLTISFEPYKDKAEFVIDTDMRVTNIEYDNVRNLRMQVNDTPYFPDNGFEVKNGDTIKLKILQIDVTRESAVRFIGVDPNYVYDKDNVPESVSDEPVRNESLEG